MPQKILSLNMSVKEIRAKLKQQLQVEPGIMSFAYPYVRLWHKLDEAEVKAALASVKEGILYVHTPFCLKKCGYCDYASNYGTEERHAEYKPYVDAVEKEIGLLLPIIKDVDFKAVYFGGGTPTIFCEKGLERIVKLVTANFSVSDAEISMEVYPWRKMLRDKLALLVKTGISRVSIGVQDFDDEVIAFSGRKYSGQEASEVVEEAMALFGDVNVDLICGLPKQTNWQQTLETTLGLSPPQVTVQPFSNRHPGIRFNAPRYRPFLPDFAQTREMYALACQMLSEAGYRQTSRHHFVREGSHTYEQNISRSGSRIGIGAHSISLLPGLTYKNFTSLREYEDAVGREELPVESGFRIDKAEEMRSFLFYALSECASPLLSETLMLERFGQRVQDAFPDEVQALKEERLIEVDENDIHLTPEGIYFTSVLQRTFYNPEFMKRKAELYGTEDSD